MHSDPLQRALSIGVFGPFVIRDDKGAELLTTGKKEIALCALLASAKDGKRTRNWLKKTLWSDRSEEQAATSLRRALANIRKVSGSHRDCLKADRLSVGWNLDRVHVLSYEECCLRNEAETLEFLQGIDTPDKEFKRWLQDRRLHWQSKNRGSELTAGSAVIAHNVETSHPLQSVVVGEQPMSVAVFPVSIATEADRYLADSVADVIVNTIDQQRFIDIYDLRHFPTEGLHQSRPGATIGLRLRLLRADRSHHLFVSISSGATGRVLWTQVYRNLFEQEERRSKNYTLLRTSSAIANSIYDQVFAICQRGADNTLAGAMHQVLSHSRVGQDSARQILSDLADDSPVARAWLIYTYAVAHAERHGGLGRAELEELDEHCRLASSAGSANPIVQAIVGHITAFVFRRLDLANSHHEKARQLGWNHPIVWALSAMHANYTNRPEIAYRYSRRSLMQSEFSPYRFCFEGPHSISCSLTNRHQEAISIGQRVLAGAPGLLAVMRHMAASQIMTGDLSEARQTVEFIRSKDQRFTVAGISEDDYPLPSDNSVQLIEHALKVAGLKQQSREI